MADKSNLVVEVEAEGMVKPARPSPQAWLALSPCDVLMREINYTRRVLFYRRPAAAADEDEDEDEDEYWGGDAVRRLEDSLAQALAYFYPLAGRLALRHGRLLVHCNDKGAELVRARLRGGPTMRQLQASSFSTQPFFSHLARWASYSRPLHEGSAPLLSIQVTRFTCGGIALGVALSHIIADGTSFWHFMTSWAECARGKMPSLLPLHKRNLLGDRAVSASSQKVATDDFYEDLHDDHPSIKSEKKVEKCFSVSREMVGKMKDETNHEYSAYELVCAQVWKHSSRAWEHPYGTRVGFINVVNMRERMIPPLPRGYFGNAILWSIATATSGQLKEESLATTAARIHEAVVACSSSRMDEFLRALDEYSLSGFTQHKILQPLYCNGVRMRVSSSTKFPVSSVNFGWGKPLAARSASIEETNKIAFYPNPCTPGSIDLCLALPRNVMETLQSDLIDEQS